MKPGDGGNGLVCHFTALTHICNTELRVKCGSIPASTPRTLPCVLLANAAKPRAATPRESDGLLCTTRKQHKGHNPEEFRSESH